MANEQAEYPPLHGAQLVLLTIAVALATFMEVLDLTIVNVSIPAISGSLGVSPSEGTWAISSYALAAAVIQPLTGWLGRRFGEVSCFLTSMFLFLVFSALCGLATNMPMLVAGRLLQGLVSGPMIALAQALLLRNFPPETRGVAMGIWGMVIIVAPIFGPILGGWITDNLSWPWLFYINLPVGLFSLLTTWRILRKRESKRSIVPIDRVGIALLVVGVGCLQFMLDNGNAKGWFDSTEILVVGIISVVCLTYLIFWELHDRHPILDLQFFLRRNFRIGVIVTSVSYFCLFASNVLFPLWLQTTVGYTASWAGLAMAPIGIFALLMSPIIGQNMRRMNLRLAASTAFLIFGCSLLWTSTLNEQATFSQLAVPRLLMGIGMPMFFLPMNQIIMANVRPHEYASAAGLSNFMRAIAQSVSTAVMVLVWNNRTDFHHAVLVEHIRPDAPGFTQTQQVLSQSGLSEMQSFAYVERVISQQASTLGVNDAYLIIALIYFVLVFVLWLSKPPFLTNSDGTMH